MARRSRRKSLPQHIVGTVATGMPSPVKKLLTGRLTSLLIVLAVPTLIGLGIVSFDWKNGRPHLSINQERAAEVRETVGQTVGKEVDQWKNDGNAHGFAGLQHETGLHIPDLPKPDFSAEGERLQQFEEAAQDKLNQVESRWADRYSPPPSSGFRSDPGVTTPPETQRPLLGGLRERFQNAR